MSNEWPYSPGWWGILDQFVEQAKEVDPDVVLEFKDKYGTLRIFFATEKSEAFNALSKLSADAEYRSGTTCEVCGQPGRLRKERSWIHTICDRCASLPPDERWKVREATEERYYGDNRPEPR